MTDGGETKMRKAKVVEREKGHATADRRRPETNPIPKKAKATKVDRKARAKPIDLPSEIALPKPAVTVTKQDTKIVIAEKGNTMKNTRRLPKPTMVNTSLTFRLMKQK